MSRASDIEMDMMMANDLRDIGGADNAVYTPPQSGAIGVPCVILYDRVGLIDAGSSAPLVGQLLEMKIPRGYVDQPERGGRVVREGDSAVYELRDDIEIESEGSTRWRVTRVRA